jgi:acid phosphatase family membrane protein YuiD
VADASNSVFFISLLAMILAQIAKVFWIRFTRGQWRWHAALESGGMPSSHSALVSALATSMWLYYGFHSSWFAVVAISALIVIYDATGVRRQAGEQAKIIEHIVKQLNDRDIKIDLGEYEHKKHWRKEGHTPLEICVGVLFGVLVALIAYFV